MGTYSGEKNCKQIPHKACKPVQIPKYHQVPQEQCKPKVTKECVQIPQAPKCSPYTVPHCQYVPQAPVCTPYKVNKCVDNPVQKCVKKVHEKCHPEEYKVPVKHEVTKYRWPARNPPPCAPPKTPKNPCK